MALLIEGPSKAFVLTGAKAQERLDACLDGTLAPRFGAAAVRCADRGEFDVMVASRPPRLVAVPLAEAIVDLKAVTTDCDAVQTARDLGDCLGD